MQKKKRSPHLIWERRRDIYETTRSLLAHPPPSIHKEKEMQICPSGCPPGLSLLDCLNTNRSPTPPIETSLLLALQISSTREILEPSSLHGTNFSKSSSRLTLEERLTMNESAAKEDGISTHQESYLTSIGTVLQQSSIQPLSE